jgi:MoaA/NifB/PqqE/SkfB family radical SAM enzyme
VSVPSALRILYRGPLESCNYACEYCPFAKQEDSPATQAADRAALARFVAWCGDLPATAPGVALGVFFTPWGEALVRSWYCDALVELSRMPHVERAAVQTNLSARLDWLERADATRIGLWSTFHPGQTTRARFVRRVLEARERGARLSAGVVGLREHLDEVEALRRDLPDDVYVWVNAYKRVEAYYSAAEVARIEAVDPLFRWNTVRHPSLGRACRAGASVIAVDGDGAITRCHFVPAVIGDLYAPDGLASALAERPCPNATCGCHIGYVHMDHLGLGQVFGSGILERIPAEPVWRRQAPATA